MSGSLFIPQGYRPILALQAVETAIKDIKDFFERNLAAALNLQRVTAPLFVRSGTGINDDLNGVEQPVRSPSRRTAVHPSRSSSRWPSGNGWPWRATAFTSARASTPT